MSKLRVLDLFSGIGGFSLGLERTGGFETVAFCEIEEFPRQILKKHWPGIYCHKDVKTLTKEALWNGYAENAAANHLCKVTGGNLASVKSAIESIRESAAAKTLTSTMNGPQSVDEALLNIMAESVAVAGKPNTHFWQSITLIMTAAQNAKSTNELLGKSLSSADFQTIIKFFVTTATWQKPFTEHARMKAAMGVKFFHDVRELTAERLAADGITVDVITGGFPCQDISTAGKQAGMSEGTRSGLWSEIVRLIGELRPEYIILENVTNLLRGPAERPGEWFGKILGDLAERRYDAEWDCFRGTDFGLPQERPRVFIVAYPNEDEHPAGLANISNRNTSERSTYGHHSQGQTIFGQRFRPHARCGGKEMVSVGWRDKFRDAVPGSPLVVGVADGLPDWLDRESALGNTVIPQIPEMIGHAILQARVAA